MLYRNFAIATLLAAPIIVMATQAMLPQAAETASQDASPITPDVAPPPVPVPVAPPVAPPGAPAIAAAETFGQPMSSAGQPMLSPGAGLPEQVAPPASGGMAFSPASAPPGSPNAE